MDSIDLHDLECLSLKALNPKKERPAKPVVDFTPNPNRKHSRGFRGKHMLPDMGTYQLDWEMDHEDRHKRTVISNVVGRRKAKMAEAKQFASRGYRGKLKRNDPRIPRMANKARVHAGTGGISKKLRKFKQEEGLMAKPRHNPKVPQIAAASAPIDQVKSIALWKRKRSKLPTIVKDGVVFVMTVDEFHLGGMAYKEKLSKAGITTKQYAAFLNDLRVRGGVELNPGPLDKAQADAAGLGLVETHCVASGMQIRAEMVRIKGTMLAICPFCFTKCTRIKRSKFFVHPCDSSDPNVDPNSLPILTDEQVKRMKESTPKELPDKKEKEPLKEKSPEKARSPAPSKDKGKREDEGCSKDHEDVHPPEELDGHHMDADQLEIFCHKLCLDVDTVEIEDLSLPCGADNRVEVNRGPPQRKGNLHYVKLHADGLHPFFRPLYLYLIFSKRFSRRPALSCMRYLFEMRYIILFLVTFCFSLHFVFACLKDFFVITWIFAKCHNFIVKKIWRRQCVYYCPYLLSSVLSEVSTLSNEDSLRTSVRSRMCQLPTIPIPAKLSEALLNGTEVAILSCRSSSFFGEVEEPCAAELYVYSEPFTGSKALLKKIKSTGRKSLHRAIEIARQPSQFSSLLASKKAKSSGKSPKERHDQEISEDSLGEASKTLAQFPATDMTQTRSRRASLSELSDRSRSLT